MTRIFIHRFRCNCGAVVRADRAIDCNNCGKIMDHEEKIGEINIK